MGMNKRSGKFTDSLRDGFVYCTNISNTYRCRGVLVGSNCSGGGGRLHPRWDTCSIHDGEGGCSCTFLGLKINTLCVFLGQTICQVFL